jgi:hypothetical protein
MMGRLERCARLISAAAQHDEHVFSVAEGAAPRPDIEELSISWQRSANSHRVDPVDSKAPRVLTPRELKDFREPLGKLILGEQEEIDRLYKVVREAGYTVLFCDTAGVAVEHRGLCVRMLKAQILEFDRMISLSISFGTIGLASTRRTSFPGPATNSAKLRELLREP